MAKEKTEVSTAHKLRCINRLSGVAPRRTAEDRLAKILDVASGKINPEDVPRRGATPDLAKRVHEGRDSRAKGNALDRISDEGEREKEVARRQGKSHDRKGGKSSRDRSAE